MVVRRRIRYHAYTRETSPSFTKPGLHVLTCSRLMPVTTVKLVVALSALHQKASLPHDPHSSFFSNLHLLQHESSVRFAKKGGFFIGFFVKAAVPWAGRLASAIAPFFLLAHTTSHDARYQPSSSSFRGPPQRTARKNNAAANPTTWMFAHRQHPSLSAVLLLLLYV